MYLKKAYYKNFSNYKKDIIVVNNILQLCNTFCLKLN